MLLFSIIYSLLNFKIILQKFVHLCSELWYNLQSSFIIHSIG
ncbi:hypothetical protein EVA_15646 [gut metagenome]|uniref:Uncharacterized protein n=1 Tax=gut metagenome TaxID=749906 RepID=J9G360_9ZZZZ